MHSVLFDGRWLRPGMTGVGVYALRILEALHEIIGPNDTIGLILPEGSQYTTSFPRFRVHTTSIDLTAHPLTDLYEQLAIPALCYRHGYCSFVSFEGRVPAFHPWVRTFSLIYDVSFLKVPGSHNRKYSFFLGWNLRLSILTASRIVTISKTVRDDLLRYAGVPGKKVIVVYPADSGLRKATSTGIDGLSKPYFLAVGMTNPRKNLEALIRGVALFRARHPEFRLAVTGNAALIDKACKAEGSEGVDNLGFVDEGRLKGLYENAHALVYPSLDEGFGIPLLDAFGFGCPVLCSDIPIFREVAGEVAAYFDPRSLESIVEIMEAATERPSMVGSQEILERYSWEKSARVLLEEIQSTDQKAGRNGPTSALFRIMGLGTANSQRKKGGASSSDPLYWIVDRALIPRAHFGNTVN